MNLSIKQLKVNHQLSEETLCFGCLVYVDGKKAFTAINRGMGGSNEYCPVKGNSYEEIRKAEAWAKEEHPDEREPLDSVIYQLVERESVRKELVKGFKKSVIFFLHGALRETTTPGVTPDRMTEFKDKVVSLGGVVLNDLPIEEAIDVYLECSND